MEQDKFGASMNGSKMFQELYYSACWLCNTTSAQPPIGDDHCTLDDDDDFMTELFLQMETP